MLTYALLLRHIGTYHHARLEALCQSCSVSVFIYGDMQGVAYDKHIGERSYRCFSVSGDYDKQFSTVREFLNFVKPVVIVLPGWAESASLTGLRWALDHQTPTIVLSDSQEKDEVRTVWKEWIKARIVRLFSAALVAGQNHIPYVVKLGVPIENVYMGVDVVDNAYFQIGADEARSKRDKLCDDLGLPKSFFLASNRFLPRKNVIGIVSAYARYREAGAPGDWGLVLLGDGVERGTIETECAKLGIKNHVVLCGLKPYKELPVYYGLAGSFVHASFSEQWGLVVNEAMAAGLPVLVSNPCGCVPDLVNEGVNGYTFDPYNFDELANHMIKMANDEYDREAIGRASREIISRWTPELFAQNLNAAALAALESPLPKPTVLDRLLLWGLSFKKPAVS